MSNLAIAAAHLVAIPARYAVGRWHHIPIATLLVFNATDLGLNILARSIAWKLSDTPKWRSLFFSRAVFCLTAMYAASNFAQPIPVGSAALTHIASLISVTVAVGLADWITGEK
jgi:hypothetical protein